MQLVPCLQCHRHVRLDAAQCPFCAAPLDASANARVVPGTSRRLDRLAFFTFATTFAVAACSSGGPGTLDDDGGVIQNDGGSDGGAKDDGGVAPLYGLPADAGPKDDGGVNALYGAAYDAGGAQPPYGLPPLDGGAG